MPCSFSPPARRMCPRRCAPPRSGRIRFRSRASFPAVKRPFPCRRARCIRSFRTESASRRGRGRARGGDRGGAFPRRAPSARARGAHLRYAARAGRTGSALAFRSARPAGLFRARRSLAGGAPLARLCRDGRQRPPPGGGSAPFLRSGRDARPRPARGIFLRARGGRHDDRRLRQRLDVHRAAQRKDRGASAGTAAAPCFFCRTKRASPPQCA